tara:strand:+ start:542 stop:1126 length:585 start_codon:yes stop_codon:yes gene_type:complete
MPDFANTAIKICSRASMLIGGSPIQSFTDGTTESDLADAVYEDIVRAVLTSSRWRFATKQFQLNRLTDTPIGRWDATYQLPSDTLMVNAITVQDLPIEYNIYEDKVFNNANETDEVIVDYIFRASESTWAPYFTLGVEFSIASVFAVSLARDAALSSAMDQQANIQLIKARRLDSQAQTTKKLNTKRFITERLS